MGYRNMEEQWKCFSVNNFSVNNFRLIYDTISAFVSVQYTVNIIEMSS
jgi:hypothetical protein